MWMEQDINTQNCQKFNERLKFGAVATLLNFLKALQGWK